MEPEHFPPSGQALGSAHVLGEKEGAGARAAPAGDGDVRGSRGASSRPLLSPPAASAPRCSRGREGGGRGQRRRRWWWQLLSRWRRRPDGAGAATAADAVQRNGRWGWSVAARGGGVGGRRARRGLWWLLLVLFPSCSVSPVSRGTKRGGTSAPTQKEEGRARADRGGGEGGGGEGSRRRGGKMASAPARRHCRHKAGSD